MPSQEGPIFRTSRPGGPPTQGTSSGSNPSLATRGPAGGTPPPGLRASRACYIDAPRRGSSQARCLCRRLLFPLVPMLYAFVDESYTRDRYYVSAYVVPEPSLAAVRAALRTASGYAAGFGISAGAEFHGYELMSGRGEWKPVRGRPRAAVAIYRFCPRGACRRPRGSTLRPRRRRGAVERSLSVSGTPHLVALRHSSRRSIALRFRPVRRSWLSRTRYQIRQTMRARSRTTNAWAPADTSLGCSAPSNSPSHSALRPSHPDSRLGPVRLSLSTDGRSRPGGSSVGGCGPAPVVDVEAPQARREAVGSLRRVHPTAQRPRGRGLWQATLREPARHTTILRLEPRDIHGSRGL